MRMALLNLDPDYCKPGRSNIISGIQTQTNVETVVSKQSLLLTFMNFNIVLTVKKVLSDNI